MAQCSNVPVDVDAGMIADRDSQLKRITRVLEARERALAEARSALEEAQRAPPPPPAPASPAMQSGQWDAGSWQRLL